MVRCTWLLLLFLFFPLPAIAAGTAPVGHIARLQGKADLLHAGATRAVALFLGEPVHLGDIVRTKRKSRVTIAFIDHSTMDLGPKSRLGIEKYLFDAKAQRRRVTLKLYRGRSGFQVAKIPQTAGNRFEMKTRTAVAGVRGTAGLLLSGEVERIYVTEGLVAYSNGLGQVLVHAGWVAEADRNRPPLERRFTQVERRRLLREAPAGRSSPLPSKNGKGTEPSRTSLAPSPLQATSTTALAPVSATGPALSEADVAGTEALSPSSSTSPPITETNGQAVGDTSPSGSQTDVQVTTGFPNTGTTTSGSQSKVKVNLGFPQQ